MGKRCAYPTPQQLQNNPNQKTKPPHNLNMGWEHTATTHPHKEKNALSRRRFIVG